MPKYNRFLVEIYPVVPQFPDVPAYAYQLICTDDDPGSVMMRFLEFYDVGPEFTVSCNKQED